MDNINFITEPNIFKIGQTRIDTKGLKEFLAFIVRENPENPPVILERIMSDAMAMYTRTGTDMENTFGNDIDLMAEIGGRLCYQSWWKGRDPEEYIENILEQMHGSVIEHGSLNFIITGVSRSLTHELIRHRVGTAISEMSQRFVGGNEKSSKWNIVIPAAYRDVWEFDQQLRETTLKDTQKEIDIYLKHQSILRDMYKDKYSGFKLTKIVNEAAREFLPNMVETRMVWSVNARTLRHVLDKRGSIHADKQISEFSKELLTIVEKCNIKCLSDIEDNGQEIVTKYMGV